jgi:hypothetical protein
MNETKKKSSGTGWSTANTVFTYINIFFFSKHIEYANGINNNWFLIWFYVWLYIDFSVHQMFGDIALNTFGH